MNASASSARSHSAIVCFANMIVFEPFPVELFICVRSRNIYSKFRYVRFASNQIQEQNVFSVPSSYFPALSVSECAVLIQVYTSFCFFPCFCFKFSQNVLCVCFLFYFFSFLSLLVCYLVLFISCHIRFVHCLIQFGVHISPCGCRHFSPSNFFIYSRGKKAYVPDFCYDAAFSPYPISL